MRNFAKRLMACETLGAGASPPDSPPGFPVCEKLRTPLATLMGNTGFHALLARALALASAEVRWLRTVQIDADGSLATPDERDAPINPEQAAEGSIVLVAQLLGLLVAFVGEDLTLRLTRDVWPDMSLDDSRIGTRRRE